MSMVLCWIESAHYSLDYISHTFFIKLPHFYQNFYTLFEILRAFSNTTTIAATATTGTTTITTTATNNNNHSSKCLINMHQTLTYFSILNTRNTYPYTNACQLTSSVTRRKDISAREILQGIKTFQTLQKQSILWTFSMQQTLTNI
jgi:hypothetical protein